MILYIIPTAICIVPLATVHTVLLILAAVLRGIFLARNFSQRIRAIQSKGIIYFVVGAIQALEFIIWQSTFFAAHITPAAAAAVTPAHPLHPLLRATGTVP